MQTEQIISLLIPVGFIAIMYFFMIRPQNKKNKEIQEMRENIKVGDRIVTIGGILGTITAVKEDMISVEVGPTKTKLDLTRWSVGSVLEDGEIA